MYSQTYHNLFVRSVVTGRCNNGIFVGGLMCTVKVILFASCFGFDTGFAISWFGFENNVYLCDTL